MASPAPHTELALEEAPRRAWVVIHGKTPAQAVAMALELAGWQVVGLSHTMEGTLHALDQDGPPCVDVVVCGLHFSDGDGFRLIRRLSRLAHPPALFVASRQQRAVIKAAIALAEACGLTVAGWAEQPVEPEWISRSLASFEAGQARVRRRIPLRELTHTDLRALLDQDRIEPWMQPKVRLSTGEVVGFEALMRAHDAQGALVMPDRLIHALLAHDLLDEATLCMARKTVDFVATCLHEGMAISASINVSMSSLSKVDFCRKLVEVVQQGQVDPGWITIEITETDAMSDLPAVIENSARIRMLGFTLAIDDFGTGYSSMFQLSHLPFSELKIERMFIANADEDNGKQAIVRTCAQLGTSLGLHVVAEGVETPQELDVARASGCSEVQGYLVARPMPVELALQWLRNLDQLQVRWPGASMEPSENVDQILPVETVLTSSRA